MQILDEFTFLWIIKVVMNNKKRHPKTMHGMLIFCHNSNVYVVPYKLIELLNPKNKEVAIANNKNIIPSTIIAVL